MNRAGEARLAIAHKNTSHVVSKITSIIAESGLEVVDMLNKSRAEVAYTLVDINSKFSNELVENLIKIEGVLKVRAL